MLELRALIHEQLRLHARLVEQRLLLQDVEARHGAQIVLRFHIVERFLLQIDGAVQHVDFRVELAHRKVIAREIGREHEARIGEIVARLIGARMRGFHFAPDAAEEIDVVIDARRELQIVLHCRTARRRVVGDGPVARYARARGVRAEIDFGSASADVCASVARACA